MAFINSKLLEKMQEVQNKTQEKVLQVGLSEYNPYGTLDPNIDNLKYIKSAINSNVIDADTVKKPNGSIRIAGVDAIELPFKHEQDNPIEYNNPNNFQQQNALNDRQATVEWLTQNVLQKNKMYEKQNTNNPVGYYGRDLADIVTNKSSLANSLLNNGNAMPYFKDTKTLAEHNQKKNVAFNILNNLYQKAIQTQEPIDIARFHENLNKLPSNLRDEFMQTAPLLDQLDSAVLGATANLIRPIESLIGSGINKLNKMNGNEQKQLNNLKWLTPERQKSVFKKHKLDLATDNDANHFLSKILDKESNNEIKAYRQPSIAETKYQAFQNKDYKSAIKELGSAIYNGVVNKDTATIAIGTALGGAIGDPELGVMASDYAVGKGHYNDLVKQGVKPENAIGASILYSIMNHVEAGNLAGKMMGKQFITGLAKSMGTEAFAEIVQNEADYLSKAKNIDLDKMKQIAISTGFETLPIGTVGGISHIAKNIATGGSFDLSQKQTSNINTNNAVQNKNKTNYKQDIQINNVNTQNIIQKQNILQKSKNVKQIEETINTLNKDEANILHKTLSESNNERDNKIANAIEFKYPEVLNNNPILKKHISETKIVEKTAQKHNIQNDKKTNFMNKLLSSLSSRRTRELNQGIEETVNKSSIEDFIAFLQKNNLIDSSETLNLGKEKKSTNQRYEKIVYANNGKYIFAKDKENGWGMYDSANGIGIGFHKQLLIKQLAKKSGSTTQKTFVDHIGIKHNAMYRELFGKPSTAQRVAEFAEAVKNAKPEDKPRVRKEFFDNVNQLDLNNQEKEFLHKLFEENQAIQSKYEKQNIANNKLSTSINKNTKHTNTKQIKNETPIHPLETYNTIQDVQEATDLNNMPLFDIKNNKIYMNDSEQQLVGSIIKGKIVPIENKNTKPKQIPKTNTVQQQKSIGSTNYQISNQLTNSKPEADAKFINEQSKTIVKNNKNGYTKNLLNIIKKQTKNANFAIAKLGKNIIIATRTIGGNFAGSSIDLENGEFVDSSSYHYTNTKKEGNNKEPVSYIKGIDKNGKYKKTGVVLIFENLKDYLAVLSHNQSYIQHDAIILNGSGEINVKSASKQIDKLKTKKVIWFAQLDSANKNAHQMFLNNLNTEPDVTLRIPNKKPRTNIRYKKFHQQYTDNRTSIKIGSGQPKAGQIFYSKADTSTKDKGIKSEDIANLEQTKKDDWFSDNRKQNDTYKKRQEFINTLIKLGLHKNLAYMIARLIQIRAKSQFMLFSDNLNDKTGLTEKTKYKKYGLRKNEFNDVKAEADFYPKIIQIIENYKNKQNSSPEQYDTNNHTIYLRAIHSVTKIFKQYGGTKGFGSKIDHIAQAHLFTSILHELIHHFEYTLNDDEKTIFNQIFANAKISGLDEKASKSEAFAMLLSNYIINDGNMHDILTLSTIGSRKLTDKVKTLIRKFFDFVHTLIFKYLPNSVEADKELGNMINANNGMTLLFRSLFGDKTAFEELAIEFYKGNFNIEPADMSNLNNRLNELYKINNAELLEKTKMFKEYRAINNTIQKNKLDDDNLHKNKSINTEKFIIKIASQLYVHYMNKLYNLFKNNKQFQIINHLYNQLKDSTIAQELKVDLGLISDKQKKILDNIYTVSNKLMNQAPNLAKVAIQSKMEILLKDANDETKSLLSKVLIYTGLYATTETEPSKFLELLKNITNEDFVKNEIEKHLNIMMQNQDKLSNFLSNKLTKEQLTNAIDQLAYFQINHTVKDGFDSKFLQTINSIIYNMIGENDIGNENYNKLYKQLNYITTLMSMQYIDKKEKEHVLNYIKKHEQQGELLSLVLGLSKEFRESMLNNNDSAYIAGYVELEQETPKDIIIIKNINKANELKYKNKIADWKLISENYSDGKYEAIFIRHKIEHSFVDGLIGKRQQQIGGKLIHKDNIKKYDYNLIPIYNNYGLRIGFKKIIPLDIARKYSNVNEDIINIMSSMAYNTEINKSTKLLNNVILNNNTIDASKLEKDKNNNLKNKDKIFVTIEKNDFGEPDEEILDDLPSDFYKYYKKVNSLMLPKEFKDVAFIRKDVYNKILGYKKDFIFGNKNRAVMFSEKIFTDFIKIFKKNILKYPPVIVNNLISGIVIMASSIGIQHLIKQSPFIIKDIMDTSRNLIKLREQLKKYYIADLSGNKKLANKYFKFIQNNPMNFFYEEGFIQSLTDDIMQDGYKNSNLIEFYGEKVIKKSLEKISKITYNDKHKNSLQNTLNTLYLSENSKVGSSLISVLKYTDYVLRVATYKALIRKGETKDKAKNIAINSYVDYRSNALKIINLLSTYGIMPFGLWMVRMQPAMMIMLKENPATTLPLLIGAHLFQSDFTGSIRTSSWNVFNDYGVGLLNAIQNPVDPSHIVPPHIQALWNGTVGGEPVKLSRLLGFTIK